MTTLRRAAACALILAASSSTAFASAIDEARALFDEGKEFLKKGRGPTADVIKWNKKAIAKFEEAVAKLEGAADESPEAELQQNINALLFWTKRTTPMDMSAILGGSGGSGGPGSPGGGSTTPEPPPPPKPPPARSPKRDGQSAVRALARAETYAGRHPNDPLTCAARFFEVADRFKDFPDIAFKAISRAQEFQRRADGRKKLAEAEARFSSLAADERLMVEGDRAVANQRYDEATAKYKRAIGMKPTPGRHRKLGHACFVRAQELRAEYSKAYLAALGDYRRAKARRDKAAMARAGARARAAGSIGKRAVATYEEARKTFDVALKASPDRLDIDSELHVALTLSIRKEKYNRDRAQKMFEGILLKYHGKVKTEEERTLYAYGETYAGPAAAARVRRRIAQKAAGGKGAAGSGAAAAAAEKSPGEMTAAELRKAIANLKVRLRIDEVKLKNSQLSGRFDMKLLKRVNDGKQRLKELEAESSKRGAR